VDLRHLRLPYGERFASEPRFPHLQNHRSLSGGHFIQEDDPAEFVDCILEIARQ